MPNILITGSIHHSGMDVLLAQAGYRVASVASLDAPEAIAELETADALLIRTSQLTRGSIAKAGRLRVVARYGVGVDNIDVAALTEQKIPLAIVGTANVVSVAEHAFFLLIAVAKAGLRYDRAVREHRWGFRDSFEAVILKDRTLLVVGAGRIGREVGRRAEAFGMRIAYFDPAIDLSRDEPSWQRCTSLEQGLDIADAVTIHVPLTEQTKGMFGEQTLSRLKRGAIVISTSRGGVVDEHALAAALVSGHVRGAGLDVFEREPIEKDNPLLGIDTAILSPHSAALSEEGAALMAITAARNCIDGLNGHLNPALVLNWNAVAP